MLFRNFQWTISCAFILDLTLVRRRRFTYRCRSSRWKPYYFWYNWSYYIGTYAEKEWIIQKMDHFLHVRYKIFYLGSSSAMIIFYPLLQTGSLFWTSFASAYNSFFLIPLVPIMLELGCELAFPVG